MFLDWIVEKGEEGEEKKGRERKERGGEREKDKYSFLIYIVFYLNW